MISSKDQSFLCTVIQGAAEGRAASGSSREGADAFLPAAARDAAAAHVVRTCSHLLHVMSPTSPQLIIKQPFQSHLQVAACLLMSRARLIEQAPQRRFSLFYYPAGVSFTFVGSNLEGIDGKSQFKTVLFH